MLAPVANAAAPEAGSDAVHLLVTQPPRETLPLTVSLVPKIQVASVISFEAEATLTIPSRAKVLSEAKPSSVMEPDAVPLHDHSTVTPLAFKTSNSVSILKKTYSPASAA